MNAFSLLIIPALALSSTLPQAEVIHDDLNHPFLLGSPPQRIVSLAPNITEILCALGLMNKLVGVTRYCDFPPPVREKEKIGGFLDPNIEKIQSLRPDLIIAFRGNPLRLLHKLGKLGFPVFVLDTGKSLEDLYLTIIKIGRVTRAEAEAAFLVETLKKKNARVQKAVETSASRPTVFLSLSGKKLWTCGKESFLNDLIAKAGGRNIAGGISREWLVLSPEQVVYQNPDVVIILAPNEENFASTKGWLLKHPHLKRIRAIQKNRLFFLDENMASRFGPRLVDACYELARLLHPDQIQGEE